MDVSSDFYSLWNSLGAFQVPPDQAEDTSCIFAQKFAEWAAQLLERTKQDASLVSLNQTKVLLMDKYFEWRAVVPKSHRNRIGRLGHRCIFQVFAQTYETLKAAELAITPPLLFVPSPPAPLPAPPPAPQIAGIFLGELEEGK